MHSFTTKKLIKQKSIQTLLRVNYLFFNVSTEAGLQNKKYQSEKMLIKRNHLKGSTLHLYRNSEVEKKEHECSETGNFQSRVQYFFNPDPESGF